MLHIYSMYVSSCYYYHCLCVLILTSSVAFGDEQFSSLATHSRLNLSLDFDHSALALCVGLLFCWLLSFPLKSFHFQPLTDFFPPDIALHLFIFKSTPPVGEKRFYSVMLPLPQPSYMWGFYSVFR